MGQFEATRLFADIGAQQQQQTLNFTNSVLTENERQRVEYDRRWQRQYSMFEDVMAPTMEKFFGNLFDAGIGEWAQGQADQARVSAQTDVALAEREGLKKIARAAMEDARRAQGEGRAITAQPRTGLEKGVFEEEAKEEEKERKPEKADEGEKEPEYPKTGQRFGGTRTQTQEDVEGLTEEEFLERQKKEDDEFSKETPPTAADPSATRGSPSQQPTDPPQPQRQQPPGQQPPSPQPGGLTPQQQANIAGVRQAAEGMMPQIEGIPTTTFSFDIGNGKDARFVKDPYSENWLVYGPNSTEPTMVSPQTFELFREQAKDNALLDFARAKEIKATAVQSYALDSQQKAVKAVRAMNIGLLDKHVRDGNITQEMADKLSKHAGYLDAKELDQFATGRLTLGQGIYSAEYNKYKGHQKVYEARKSALTSLIHDGENKVAVLQGKLEGAIAGEDEESVAAYRREIDETKSLIRQREEEKKRLKGEWNSRYDPNSQAGSFGGAINSLSHNVRGGRMTDEMEALLKLAAWDMGYHSDMGEAWKIARDMEANGWQDNPQLAEDFYKSFVSRAIASGWTDIPTMGSFMGGRYMDEMAQGESVIDKPAFNFQSRRSEGSSSQNLPPVSEATSYDPDDPYWKTVEGARIQSIIDGVKGMDEAINLMLREFPKMMPEDLPLQVRYAIQELGSGADQAKQEATVPQDIGGP